MNALGHDDLSESLGINPDVKLAGERRSDFKLTIRPGNGLAQSLTFSPRIVTAELNRSIGQSVALRVGDLAPQGNLFGEKRKRKQGQQNSEDCQVFAV
jgi:hypothetical protein